jgi:hypothetical protein
MPESKKRTAPKNSSASKARKRLAQIDPRGPWKPSWWVLWGFISVVGELILIFLVRGQAAKLSTLQIVIIGVCIPLLAHMLVSGLRTLLFVTSR